MGWKCTPQVTGLVRGEAKQGQKHRSNVTAIVAEAGKERVSNSDTLDRDRTYLNRYTGFSSGFECADYITKEADDYKQEVIGKGGTKHYRKLRADAVIGYAVIYNPPEEVCKSWTDEEYTKFYEDSRDVMEQICPDIFRRDTVIMSSEHFDEGTIADPTKISRHVHDIGIPKSKDGHYCGTKIDAKLLVEINKNYPCLMRQRGWDIEDLDCTDWDRYKTDEAYRNERKSKKKSGKGVNNYIADKMREQIQENESMSEIMCSAILDALEVTEEKDRLEALKEQIEADKAILKAEREQLEKDKGKLFKEMLLQEKKEKEFQHKEDMLEAQRNALEQERKDIQKKSDKDLLCYKLAYKKECDRRMQNYKSECEEAVQEISDYASSLPPLSEDVEKVLDYASVQESGRNYRTPARKYLQTIQNIRQSTIKTYREIPDIPKDDSQTGYDMYLGG